MARHHHHHTFIYKGNLLGTDSGDPFGHPFEETSFNSAAQMVTFYVERNIPFGLYRMARCNDLSEHALTIELKNPKLLISYIGYGSYPLLSDPSTSKRAIEGTILIECADHVLYYTDQQIHHDRNKMAYWSSGNKFYLSRTFTQLMQDFLRDGFALYLSNGALNPEKARSKAARPRALRGLSLEELIEFGTRKE